jgi:flagellar basal body-associated protein FliL
MGKTLKIIIAVVLVVVVGVAAYILVLSPRNEAEAGDKKPEFTYSPGDYFVSNIEDSSRLLKATIVLSVNDQSKIEYMTENNHVIRDTIIQTLRQKNEEELRSSGIQDKLRKEIVANLKARLDMDYLVTVYFEDFVLQ